MNLNRVMGSSTHCVRRRVAPPFSSGRQLHVPSLSSSIGFINRRISRHPPLPSFSPSTFSAFSNQDIIIPQCHFSSDSTKNNNNNNDDNTGESYYQQALETSQKIEDLREEREKQKSKEMYQAWQKADAKQKLHQNNPKAESLKGVAVVKTIVKQTRKERKTTLQEIEELKEQAQTLLETAALTHQHPQALILLGNDALKQANGMFDKDYQDMDACREYLEKALDYYRQAESAEGWFNVGQLLWTGYPAMEDNENDMDDANTSTVLLKADKQQSMDAFRKAIALGDPDAMYFVGVHLLSAEDEFNHCNDDNNNTPPPETLQKLQEGLELVQSSAKLGHGPARYYLALMHLNGNTALGIQPCSSEEFVKLLNDATDAGDADALFLRGHAYYEGDHGYSQNYKLALADFVAAAEAGNAEAAVSAGAVLHSGRPGVPPNQKHAFEFYQLAGEMGSLEGWKNVAACYATGEGVPQSEATAKYIIKTMLKDEEQQRNG